jgi:hypothetical protein
VAVKSVNASGEGECDGVEISFGELNFVENLKGSFFSLFSVDKDVVLNIVVLLTQHALDGLFEEWGARGWGNYGYTHGSTC